MGKASGGISRFRAEPAAAELPPPEPQWEAELGYSRLEQRQVLSASFSLVGTLLTLDSFDPGEDLTFTQADVDIGGSTVNAYICFTDLDMGLTSASFRLTDVATACPGSFAPPSFVNMISEVAICNVFTGITVASTGCEAPPTSCVGYVSLFYLGGACCI